VMTRAASKVADYPFTTLQPILGTLEGADRQLILADIPTFRELWEEVAIFVSPRDPVALARACNDLVADDFERSVRGRAAMERAARFTPDAMAAQMAGLYRRLRPGSRRPAYAARAAA